MRLHFLGLVTLIGAHLFAPPAARALGVDIGGCRFDTANVMGGVKCWVQKHISSCIDVTDLQNTAQCLAKNVSLPGKFSACKLDLYDLGTTATCLASAIGATVSSALPTIFGCSVDASLPTCLVGKATAALPSPFNQCELLTTRRNSADRNVLGFSSSCFDTIRTSVLNNMLGCALDSSAVAQGSWLSAVGQCLASKATAAITKVTRTLVAKLNLPQLDCSMDLPNVGQILNCVVNATLPAYDSVLNGGVPSFNDFSAKINACVGQITPVAGNVLTCLAGKVTAALADKFSQVQLPAIPVLGRTVRVQNVKEAGLCLANGAVQAFIGKPPATAPIDCVKSVQLDPDSVSCLQQKVSGAVSSILPAGVAEMFKDVSSLVACMASKVKQTAVDYFKVGSLGEFVQKFRDNTGDFVKKLFLFAKSSADELIPQILDGLKRFGRELLGAELTELRDPIEYALEAIVKVVDDNADWILDFMWDKISAVAAKLGPVSCFVDYVGTLRDKARPYVRSALRFMATSLKNTYVNKVRPAVLDAARTLVNEIVSRILGKDARARFQDIATRALQVVEKANGILTSILDVIGQGATRVCSKVKSALATVGGLASGTLKPSDLVDSLRELAKERGAALIDDYGSKFLETIFTALASALHIAVGVEDAAGGLVPEVGAGAVVLQGTGPTHLAWSVVRYVGRGLVLEGAKGVMRLAVDGIMDLFKGQVARLADPAVEAVRGKLGAAYDLLSGAVGQVKELLQWYLGDSGPGKKAMALQQQALTTLNNLASQCGLK